MSTEEKKNTSVSRSKSALAQVSNQLYEIGKLPPQAVELEEAVLGALMLEKDVLGDVIEILTAESFYKEAHNRIFGAIKKLSERREPVDILTVTNELKKTGELELVGGAWYISQLTNRIASSANVEFHARIIAQKSIQRSIIQIAGQAISDAYDDTCEDVFHLLDKITTEFFKIDKCYSHGKKVETLRSLLKLEQAEYVAMEQASKTNGVVGVDTGFRRANQITSGWRKPDLIIVAARPAMGKTALALKFAKTAAKTKVPTGFFSLEMASLQLVKRLLQSESEVNSYDYRNATLSIEDLKKLEIARGRLEDLGIFIDDTPALSIIEFRAKARRMVQKDGVGLIIVDYLQLMTTGEERKWGGNREQEISKISAALKQTAKELNVPIIALSQMSRAVETRGGDKKPQLSDLRESGAIEQDADIVLFIHRAEYYGITTDANGVSTKGIAELIFAKHRNGPIGSAFVGFNDALTKFYEKFDDQGNAIEQQQPVFINEDLDKDPF